MKKKISLMEAKTLLNTDKIFLNGKNLNYINLSKYSSKCTFVIPQEWYLNSDGKPENPLKYLQVPEITDNMNIDFDGTASVLFGIYRVSQAGKPVFTITPPVKAQDIFVRVNWGGAFNRTRGFRSYEPKIGEKYYLRASSNGGGTGYDYWVFPVGYVYNSDYRDVSDILLKLSETENKRIKDNEILFLEKERKKNASIERGKEIIPICKDLVIQINALLHKYGRKISIEFEEECMVDVSVVYHEISYIEAYDYLNKILITTKNMIKNREKYDEILSQMSVEITALNGCLGYCNIDYLYIEFNGRREYFYCDSLQHIKDMQDYIDKEKKKQEEERALIIENMIKAKREQEQRKAESAARAAGCPENFTYWNRVGGATGQSHAYVLRPDGSIRTPDNNILRNSNHKHHLNWLEYADGEQVYNQILIGDLIISYKKECTKKPIVAYVKWVPEIITEAQRETVDDIFNDLKQQYNNPQFVDDKGDIIKSGKEWLERK